MGIVSTSLSQSNNMKFLLVLTVAAYARAEAEAKPGFVYTVGHHAPLVYNHLPVAYTAPVGCQNNDGAAVPCAHGVFPYGLVPAVTQRLTHGCIITVLVMLPVLMDMDIMVITWDTVWVILRTTTDMLHTVITISATMERGTPRLNQLPRLLPKLLQRLTPGCTIAMLVTDSTHTDMATTAMVWAMPPMPDITPTRTMVAAEMAMEPWFPAPPVNSVEVSALVLLK